jgi:hypothetical protein
MDQFLYGFSVTGHLNIKQNAVRILNEMRVDFVNSYTHMTFKVKIILRFYCADQMFIYSKIEYLDLKK